MPLKTLFTSLSIVIIKTNVSLLLNEVKGFPIVITSLYLGENANTAETVRNTDFYCLLHSRKQGPDTMVPNTRTEKGSDSIFCMPTPNYMDTNR